ncbi:hypothetical protein HHI36_019590 [Cryptolaemus montrouzieri]|uniref:Uncharacterized protein n=1 Tax=Cryptolaemus montrouzieri TaxID=559131 RepID=A0ABD2N7U8_9CUCU
MVLRKIKEAKEVWIEEKCRKIEELEEKHDSFNINKKIRETTGMGRTRHDEKGRIQRWRKFSLVESKGFLNSEMFPSDYAVYRRDRNLTATDNSKREVSWWPFIKEIAQRDLSVLHDLVPSIGIVCFKLKANSTALFILVLYEPPSTDAATFE